MHISTEEAIIRLIWAVALGAIIGFEREWTQKSAGLRTHILVCMGSAVFTLISMSDWLDSSLLNLPTTQLPEGISITYNRDPARIAAQIVTGIGFIGGGALLHYGNNVRGVTTAASLWMMASVGMLAGIGQFLLALVAACLSFLVLFTLGKLERALFRKHTRHYEKLRLTVVLEVKHKDSFNEWLQQQFDKRILDIFSSTHQEQPVETLSYLVDIHSLKQDWTQWRKRLENRPGVRSSGVKLYLPGQYNAPLEASSNPLS